MRGVASPRSTLVKGTCSRRLVNQLEGSGSTVHVDGLEVHRCRPAARLDVVVGHASPDLGTPLESEPVVDVGSASTSDSDLGRELESSRRYPSLRHHLVVHPAERCVILVERETVDRVIQLRRDDDLIELPAIGASLSFAAILQGVPDAAGEPMPVDDDDG